MSSQGLRSRRERLQKLLEEHESKGGVNGLLGAGFYAAMINDIDEALARRTYAALSKAAQSQTEDAGE